MNELDQLFEVNIWKFIEAVIIQYQTPESDRFRSGTVFIYHTIFRCYNKRKTHVTEKTKK